MEVAARWIIGIGLFALAMWLTSKKGWGGGTWVTAVIVFALASNAISGASVSGPESFAPTQVAPLTSVPDLVPNEPTPSPTSPPRFQTPTTLACHPSYVGECLPFVSDVDCRGGSGNGPYYSGRVRVVGPDVYGLDRDNDGIGCEG